MFRAIVMTLSLAVAPLACTANPQGSEQMPASEQQAAAKAKQHLAQALNVAESDIVVKSVEAKTWNDSSLGCGKPGTVAMQVITDGHAVVLEAQGSEHVVHVAGNNAIVCDRPALIHKDRRRGAHLARGLDVMMQRAREDLATQLGVEPAAIRIAGMQPQQWADSSMECPIADQPVEPGPIAGYRLSLRHQGRLYTYHTDMKTVRACPPIAKD